MTILESISLVLVILLVTVSIAYCLQIGQLPIKDFLESTIKQQIINEIEVTAPEQVAATPVKKKKYYPKSPKTQKQS